MEKLVRSIFAVFDEKLKFTKLNRKFLHRAVFVPLFLCFFQFLPAQVLPGQQQVKFQVFTLSEGIPGLEEQVDESQNGVFSLPISHLRQTVPYILEGILYGWNFCYTPSDKTRGVEEYFEFEPINTVKTGDPRISFSGYKVDESFFSCWVSYDRTDEMMLYRKHWQSIYHPQIRGTGAASIYDGDEGFKAAYAEAAKNALRSYARGIVKNKPKEITGKVLLCEAPLMSIRNGKYVAQLEFLLEIDEILPYSSF